MEKELARFKWREILITFGIFLVVQLIASITEGAIFGIKHCTLAYYLVFAAFAVVTAACIVGIYFYINKTMKKY